MVKILELITAIKFGSAIAREEIAASLEFDVQIINDDLEKAIGQLEKAIFE